MMHGDVDEIPISDEMYTYVERELENQFIEKQEDDDFDDTFDYFRKTNRKRILKEYIDDEGIEVTPNLILRFLYSADKRKYPISVAVKKLINYNLESMFQESDEYEEAIDEYKQTLLDSVEENLKDEYEANYGNDLNFKQRAQHLDLKNENVEHVYDSLFGSIKMNNGRTKQRFRINIPFTVSSDKLLDYVNEYSNIFESLIDFYLMVTKGLTLGESATIRKKWDYKNKEMLMKKCFIDEYNRSIKFTKILDILNRKSDELLTFYGENKSIISYELHSINKKIKKLSNDVDIYVKAKNEDGSLETVEYNIIISRHPYDLARN
jgi:hypothetical protein